MAKTKDNELIKQFAVKQLNAINTELDQCNEKLTVQALRCPSTLSLETIDTSLRDFVCIHQRRLSKKMNCQLAKLKGCLGDNDLWQQLSFYHLNKDQVKHIEFHLCATLID